MLMTTDPGDLVLDPTCGSGTTAFVAEQWGRRWITCDTSRVAIDARQAAADDRRLRLLRAGTSERRRRQRIQVQDSSAHHSQVDCEQPEIKEGMTREQIDAAIATYAAGDTVRQPHEDRRRPASPARSPSKRYRRRR